VTLLNRKSMLWPENPRLILYIKELDSMLIKFLCCSGVSVAKKDIFSTDFREDRRDKGGVLISAVS
jgi:hypothetical protein